MLKETKRCRTDCFTISSTHLRIEVEQSYILFARNRTSNELRRLDYKTGYHGCRYNAHNITWYCILSLKWPWHIRDWTHKIHPISAPKTAAMGCFGWIWGKNSVITASHCSSPSEGCCSATCPDEINTCVYYWSPVCSVSQPWVLWLPTWWREWCA